MSMNSEGQTVKEEEKTAVSLRTGGFRRGKRKGVSFRPHLLTILGRGHWLLELKAWISRQSKPGGPGDVLAGTTSIASPLWS